MTDKEKYNQLLFNMIKNHPEMTFEYSDGNYHLTKLTLKRDWYELTCLMFCDVMIFRNKEGESYTLTKLEDINTLLDFLQNSWLDYLLENIC